MQWEVVIGLEVHAQLATATKIFSGSSTRYGAPPNTQAGLVDLAMPGTLPVFNGKAAELAVRFGLAVGATVNHRSIFARKNYFYPDLPKNYQLSQLDLPIVVGGQLAIHVDGKDKIIRLTRAHLEEDAGKSLHDAFPNATGIDLNRGGSPLLEIVSEPDMASAAEAVAYAKALHELVRYIGICDGNLQEGSFRCDANISVRPRGETKLGVRAEIKNLNSFRFLEKALNYEIARHIAVLEDGGQLVQETRLYDADADETRSMRTKENAHDYRYFPDPNLPPLILTDEFVKTIAADMPELPEARRQRFMTDLGLSAYDARLLTADRQTADYFDAVIAAYPVDPKLAANWIGSELASHLNRGNLSIEDSPVSPERLAQLIERIKDNTISTSAAKTVFEALWTDPAVTVDAVIADQGLQQINDTAGLEAIVDAIIEAKPQQVADYRAGREKALNALVGQAMKETQGKANPTQLKELFISKIGS